MESLDPSIKNNILSYLTKNPDNASASEISKFTGISRLTVSKYLEIMKAHDMVGFKTVGKAKIWYKGNTRKKNILIIDDEENILNLLRLTLRDKHELFFANTGKKGIKSALTQDPDVIILDLMLPDITGFEVLRILKDNVNTTKIPVLILSAKSDIESKLRGLKGGSDEYMTKPFDPLEIDAMIDSMLSNMDTSSNSISGLPAKRFFLNKLDQHNGSLAIITMEFSELMKNSFKKINDTTKLFAEILKQNFDLNSIYHPKKHIFAVFGDKDESAKIKNICSNYSDTMQSVILKIEFYSIKGKNTKDNKINEILSKVV